MNADKGPIVLFMALAILHGGCVSIAHSPTQADFPIPSLGSSPLCIAALGRTIELPKGASCMFPVRADQQLTRTPVAINSDETYRINVPKNQVWYDASRRNVPPRGEDGSWMMNLAERWKRHREAKWFALIAANVGRDDQSSECHAVQDVSLNPDIKVTKAGRLAFYPNDAIVPLLGSFYVNNVGQVWVEIEHCAEVCRSDSVSMQASGAGSGALKCPAS